MAASMGDLQMRMSKKIAQLTKVIYHLNNKNEEHELDLQEIAEQYELEIEQILKDAADKINAFKLQLDTDRDDVRLNNIVKKLEARYNEERAKAAADLEAMQQRAQEKEMAIQKAASKQLQVLTEQADSLKEQLKLRIREVDELKSTSTDKQQTLEQSLQKVKKELEEAITTGNKKYNDMLAERLKVEDDLREELLQAQGMLKEEKAARIAADQQHKKDQDHWVEERAKLENLLKDTESNWKVKAEALQSNLAQEHSQRQALEQQTESLTDELQQKALVLQQSTAQCQQLETDVAQSKVQLAKVHQQLLSATDECATLKQQLADTAEQHKANKLALQGKLDAAANHTAQLEALLQASNAKADSSMASANEQLLILKKELNSATAELLDLRGALEQKTRETEGLASQLSTAQAQLKSNNAEHKENVAQLQQKLERLSQEYDQAVKNHESQVLVMQERLQKASQDTLSASSAASAAAQQTKAELERQLADCIAAHKAELQSMVKQHQQEVAAVKDNCKQTLDDDRQKSQQLIAGLESRLKSIEQTASTDSEKHQQELQAQQLKLKQLEADMLQLQTQLQEQTSRASKAEARCADMQSRLSDTSQTADAAKAELEKKLKMYSLAEAALKDEIQASNAKLKDLQDELQGQVQIVAELRTDLQRQKDDHLQEMGTANKAQDVKIMELQAKWKSQLETEVADALRQQDARHQQQLQDLRSSLQQQGSDELTTARASMQAELQEQEARFAAKLQQLQDMHTKELGEIKQSHQDKMSQLEQQHQQTIAAANKAHQLEIDRLEAGLRGDMTGALQKMREEHQAAMQDAEGRHQQQLESLQQSAAEEQAKAAMLLQQTISDWSSKHSAEVAQLQAQQDAEMQAVKAAHTSAMGDLQGSAKRKEEELSQSIKGLEKRRAELQQQMQALEGSKAAAEAALEQAQNSLANKSIEMTNTVYKMKREYEDERSAMEQDFKRQRAALVEENAAATAVMKAEYEKAMGDMNEKVDHLMQEFMHLQEMYNNRPPRDEDVQRIQQLEQALQATEEQLRTAEERMQQLRNEMLLREENYNKHFKNGGMGERVLNVGAAMNATESVTSWMLKSKRSNSGRS